MKPNYLDGIIDNTTVKTPAFIFSKERIARNCRSVRRIVDGFSGSSLYSLKALSLPAILPLMAEILDGFSVSSLFEAKMARQFGGKSTSIFFTSPGLDHKEFEELSEICDFISLNSLGQLNRSEAVMTGKSSLGLRINPGVSFVKNDAYNPSATGSHLGIPIEQIETLVDEKRNLLSLVDGLHIHTNCESEDFSQLHTAVRKILPILKKLRGKLKWLNLGGGYYYPETETPNELISCVDSIRSTNSDLQLFFEPGTSIAQDAGILVATVVDVMDIRPIPVVVLNTTINHLPEVMEFNYQPGLYKNNSDAKYEYRVSGATCLAGDTFGVYKFSNALRVGDRVCFLEVGSYSIVKANTFNGIPTPCIYLSGTDDSMELVYEPDFQSWMNRYGSLN